MPSTPLIIAVAVLLVVLIVLTLILVLRSGSRKKIPTQQPAAAKVRGFEELASVLTASGSSQAQLQEAVEMLIEDHGTIADEQRLMRYSQLIMALCIHPRTTKELLLMFDRELGRKNPAHRNALGQALRQGLAARDQR